MCTRKEPYDTIPGFRVILAVATKRMRPKIPTSLESEWASLIRRCWSEDPENRPDFAELVEILGNLEIAPPSNPHPYKEEKDKERESNTNSNNIPITVSKQQRSDSSKSTLLRVPSSEEGEGDIDNPDLVPIEDSQHETRSDYGHDSLNVSQSEFTSRIGLVTELEPPDLSSSSNRFSLPNSVMDKLSLDSSAKAAPQLNSSRDRLNRNFVDV